MTIHKDDDHQASSIPSSSWTAFGEDVDAFWCTSNGEVAALEYPPSSLQFLRDFVSPSRPCIIRNAIPAKSEILTSNDCTQCSGTMRPLILTLDDILRYSGEDSRVTVNATPDGHGDCVRKVVITQDTKFRQIKHMFIEPEARSMTLCEFRDQLRSGRKVWEKSKKRFVEDCQELTVFPLISASKEEVDTQNKGRASQPAMEAVEGDRRVASVVYYSQQNDCLHTELRPLFKKCSIPESFRFAEEAFGTGGPDAVNLWVGDERAVSSMHKDHYENLFYVASGEKIFTLCPPCDAPFLYISEFDSGKFIEVEKVRKEKSGETIPEEFFSVDTLLPSSSSTEWLIFRQFEDQAEKSTETLPVMHKTRTVKWVEPDIIEECDRPKGATLSSRFPLLASCHQITVKVKCGEMLYIPSLWFHRVTQSSETVGINYWYDMRFDAKWCYFNLLQSLDVRRRDCENVDDVEGSLPTPQDVKGIHSAKSITK